mmetsp:Transcript_2993/g.4413  ORF Transcript_2993/g.4413 Transcript_2993/m.4413 type:complete len:173 (-) Transcript_2993:48-566(-)
MHTDVREKEPIAEFENYGGTLLHEAALQGDEESISMLLACGMKVDAIGFGGATPLHSACCTKQGQEMCVELLINRGSKIQVADNEGYTPLHRCAERGFLEGASSLLAAGAHVDTQTMDGDTALHLAYRNEFENMVILLRAFGASTSIVNSQGLRPSACSEPPYVPEAEETRS